MPTTRRDFLTSTTAAVTGALAPRAARAQAMQDALLEGGSIRKRVPLEEHCTNEFTLVRP